jgi:hypothetical protein
VPLLQAQLVDPDVGDHPLGIDLLVRRVGQLVTDDPPDGLGRDAQPAGHVLLRAADERPQDMLLEPEGVAGVPPLERRDQVLPAAAVRAAVVGRLVHPEGGLAPDVQIPDHLGGVLDLDAGVGRAAAPVTPATGRPRPVHLESVPIVVAFVSGDGDAGGQIDIDGDRGHRRT